MIGKENYNVAVIGLGIGGLSTAALLAHSGYKTLVVESKDRLGGRWSTIEREGFKTSTGAILIHRGIVLDNFKKVGAEFEVVDLPRLFYRLHGKDYEMPSKGGFSALLNIVDKLEVEKAKLVGRIVKEVAVEKMKDAMRRESRAPEKESGLNLRNWLLQYTDNELAHQVFDVIAVASMCAHSYELPARQFFQFIGRMGALRTPCVFNKGNISGAESLARVIKANGDVWLNCPAKKIVVKEGGATGIVVQKNGSEVEVTSKVVISDIGPKRTVELAGEENFGEEYVNTMNARLRPTPVTLIHIGSDIPLVMPGGEKAVLLITGARRITCAIQVTNACPEIAPRGQHLTYLCGAPISSLEHVNKDEEIRQCTLDLEELFPEFKNHGRILEMTVLDIDDEFPELRTWPGYDMPRETPIKNLYNVGDAVKTEGMTGTAAAAESGKIVAEIVRKQI